MLIQELYRDVREHRELFVLLPFKLAWQRSEYRWALGYLVFLSAVLVGTLVSHGRDAWMMDGGLQLLGLLPVIVMAPRCHAIIEQARATAVERATGIAASRHCGLSAGLRLQEWEWFQRKYRCAPLAMVALAKDKERAWRDWQDISARAASDEMDDIVRFYFRLPEAGRFMTLLAAALAVVASLIVTLGANQAAYFQLLDDWREYLRFVLMVTLLCAYLALPMLFLKGVFRVMIGALDDWMGRHTVSERSFYRFLRSMVWAAGVGERVPEGDSRVVRGVERVVAWFYLPLGVLLMRMPFWLLAGLGIALFCWLAY